MHDRSPAAVALNAGATARKREQANAAVFVNLHPLRKGSGICLGEHAQVAASVERGSPRRVRQDRPRSVCHLRRYWQWQRIPPAPRCLQPRRLRRSPVRAWPRVVPPCTVRIWVANAAIEPGARRTDADIAGSIDIDAAGGRAGPDAERQPAAAGEVADEEVRLVGADIPGLRGKAAGAGLFEAVARACRWYVM